MVGNALVDTGAIVALLDRADRWHMICLEAFPRFRLPLVTSEAVLAEVSHLLDYADFETYRIEGRRRFRVLPIARP